MFFERSKGVCVYGVQRYEEMERVREMGRAHRQLHSARTECQIIPVSVFSVVSQKIPAQSCPDMIPLPFSVIIAISTAATLTITYAS